jgi:hypothetical protein
LSENQENRNYQSEYFNCQYCNCYALSHSRRCSEKDLYEEGNECEQTKGYIANSEEIGKIEFVQKYLKK